MPESIPRPRSSSSLPSFSTPAVVRLALLLIIGLAVWVGLAPTATVPAVVPATAPAGEFSAERAMHDLQVVAAEPHPIGSPRNTVVRDYLVDQIRALGLAPEIQKATVTRWSHTPGLAWTTAVENVMVRVPGTDSSRAIMVEGHYDSVPTTAGATDCGSCVVTGLETLRATVAGPPLKNDVIFLFTDGEEVFIAGAEAFAQQHPWARDVGLSLVFEGLGTGGASMLYATSPSSGWWVDQALKAAPHPLGFSFLNDLMWTLANNSGSDLDAFVKEGQAGLAFVYLTQATAPAYHTLADNVQTVDLRSVQHHGSYAVSLVRHFGNLHLETTPGTANAVFFPIAPNVVIRYPGAWVRPLALVVLLAFTAVVVLGLRRRRLSIGGLLAGIVATLLNLIAAVILVTLAWSLIRRVDPDLHGVTVGGFYGGPIYLLAFLALTLAIVAGLHFLWRKRVALDNLVAGALAWWTLFAVLTGLGLPGFSYMFAWPLLVTLAVLGWSYARPKRVPGVWESAVMLSLPAVVGLVLLAPVIQLLSFFASRLEGALGAPLAALPIPLAVLLAGLSLPLIEFLAPARRRWLPIGATVACLVFLLIATGLVRYDAQHPKTDSITYLLDTGAGQAQWIAINDSPVAGGVGAELDAWTQQFFPNGGQETSFMPWRNGLVGTRLYPAFQAPAPPVELPGSELRVLSDNTTGNTRQLRLQVTAPEGVLTSQVTVDALGPIQTLAANGTALDLTGKSLQSVVISVIGRHATGITVDIAAPAGPVTVTVDDQRPGLPAIPDFTVTPRPAGLVPAPLADVADSTLVRRSWKL